MQVIQGESGINFEPASTRGMAVAALVNRYTVVTRFLTGTELSAEDTEYINKLDWVDYGDAAHIEDDPRVLDAQRALEEHRHDTQQERYRILCRLTEWQVLLEPIVAPHIAETGGSSQDQVA
jgi:hypothetical protein